MKRFLLLVVTVLMIANVAMADQIGVYTDASGASCFLAAGFTSSATVIHKFSVGTTGSRFKITFPAGSTFVGFNTPYAAVGDLTTGIQVGYGTCLIGANAIGQIVATLTNGVMQTLPADTFSDILVTDCSAVTSASLGQGALVGSTGYCPYFPFDPNATEGATWGSVKALYR